MRAKFAALGKCGVIGVLFVLVSGCAGLSVPGSRLDAQALQNAIVADRVDYVRAAIEARVASVNERIPAPVYAEGTPLLTIAARAGARRVTAYLIAAGANLDAPTPAGETALMLAAYFPTEGSSEPSDDHAAVARMLVEAGAALENEPGNYTPLAYAAYQGRERMIEYLLRRGAHVNPEGAAPYAYINTPLMMAVMQGHRDAALMLLRAGADPRVRVVNGHTAAELAAKYQGPAMVSLLKCAEASGPGDAFRRACEGTR